MLWFALPLVQVRTAIFLALAACPPIVQAQAPPARDVRDFELKRGTAIVRGRVTDAESGVPLARVVVSLSLLGARAQVDTKSDANGAFEFTGVPAGSYSLLADPIGRAAYRPSGFGVIPGKAPGKHSTIVLREGQVFDRADISLSRSFVISARVSDEDGEPAADVLVKAEPTTGTGPTRSRTTDDRGEVRLWGYLPGTYRVCATPRSVGPDQHASEGYIETCYPSVAAADAQPVLVASADPPQVEIRLRRSRLFRLSGFVVDASGAPAADARVFFVSVDRAGSESSGRTLQNAAGTFSIAGLAPGEYFIRAELGNPDDHTGRQVGVTPVAVQSADIDNLVVAMAAPATVNGRITFEGDAPPAGGGLTVRAMPEPESSSFATAPRPAAVKLDLSFELRGLIGPNTIQVNGAPAWAIKSVKYRGEEHANIPIDFKSDAGDVAPRDRSDEPDRQADCARDR